MKFNGTNSDGKIVIVNEFYCDARAEWRYQYSGEPDVLEWFCADGEMKEDSE